MRWRRYWRAYVSITHALLLAMLATAIFDHLFIKSNISATDRLVVVKFHINIANRWLYMIQRKIMVIILSS